jgi:hypothetical protein
MVPDCEVVDDWPLASGIWHVAVYVGMLAVGNSGKTSAEHDGTGTQAHSTQAQQVTATEATVTQSRTRHIYIAGVVCVRAWAIFASCSG